MSLIILKSLTVTAVQEMRKMNGLISKSTMALLIPYNTTPRNYKQIYPNSSIAAKGHLKCMMTTKWQQKIWASVALSKLATPLRAIESFFKSRLIRKFEFKRRELSFGYSEYVQSQMASGFNYNRKEKSLGELCKRFLYLYGGQGQDLLYLDQCTKELAVERRRIYDIINILESFNVIRRKAKNAYQWRGIDIILSSVQE